METKAQAWTDHHRVIIMPDVPDNSAESAPPSPGSDPVSPDPGQQDEAVGEGRQGPADWEPKIPPQGKTRDEGTILREYRRAMYQFSFIGIEFGVALALGFLLGRWLDKKLSTAPWLMLTCVLFGLAVASRDLYRVCRKAYLRQKQQGPGP